MKYEPEIRLALVDNTIKTIAEGGFEKATTRAITQNDCNRHAPFSLNEAYIYRLFGSKEGLYAEAFSSLDRELISMLCRRLDTLDFAPGNVREDWHKLFSAAWRFLLHNEDKCRCYTRYYYSTYFKEMSKKKHREVFGTVVDKLSPLFKPEADAVSVLHSVLTTILNFAIRVYNGDLVDTEANAEHIFAILYRTVAPYLRDAE